MCSVMLPPDIGGKCGVSPGRCGGCVYGLCTFCRHSVAGTLASVRMPRSFYECRKSPTSCRCRPRTYSLGDATGRTVAWIGRRYKRVILWDILGHCRRVGWQRRRNVKGCFPVQFCSTPPTGSAGGMWGRYADFADRLRACGAPSMGYSMLHGVISPECFQAGSDAALYLFLCRELRPVERERKVGAVPAMREGWRGNATKRFPAVHPASPVPHAPVLARRAGTGLCSALPFFRNIIQ